MTVGIDKSSNREGSHAHREISVNDFKDSEKTEDQECYQSRSSSKTPGKKRWKGTQNVVFVVDFDNCVTRNTLHNLTNNTSQQFSTFLTT
jgi:hypothetical protein